LGKKEKGRNIMEIEEILKDKPPTPKCPDESEYGPCLLWTEKEGWRVCGR